MQRQTQIERLKKENFDLLVIGGGATGAGIALDAATRDLKVALVERDDFAAGTSSRSTKLIHGGVRYLEQAVLKFDKEQYHLVRDALAERATLLKLAPHLAQPIALLTPLYSWWMTPYFRVGLKMYDWLAGKQNLSPSKYLSRKAALKNFPMIKSKGLVGGVLYYDGQFDDARMNVTVAMTAKDHGAAVANHLAVVSLLEQEGHLNGARVREEFTGEEFDIHAKAVINATGPFSDSIRHLEDPQAKPMLKTSSGIHIVLHKRFSPPATGLLIPKTEDGRVLFLLPWLGHTLVGTTDNPAKVEANPKPTEAEIDYILRHLKKYFDVPVKRGDILATWSGLRPLVSDPKASDTARLSRDHVIHRGPKGLITIAGGKWTTYRKMAEDTVNQAIKFEHLSPIHASQTDHVLLRGADHYSGKISDQLQKNFDLDADVALHLSRAYGSRAPQVAEIAREGYADRLAPDHPYIAAEVLYAAREEMACTPVDILARRTRLTFLDSAAARTALPRVIELLSQFYSWDASRRESETKRFYHYLDHAPAQVPPTAEKKSA